MNFFMKSFEFCIKMIILTDTSPLDQGYEENLSSTINQQTKS
jgi:hypothetical protein